MLGEETMSWFDARDACRNHGGYLVSIDTVEEYRVIQKFLGKLQRVNSELAYANATCLFC